MEKIWWILAAIIFGMVALADDGYEHAVEMSEHYDEMVCAGHWPDYDNREPDCSGD